MKLIIFTVVCFGIALTLSHAEVNDDTVYSAASAALESAQYQSGNAQEADRAFASLQAAWKVLPENRRIFHAYTYARSAIQTASMMFSTQGTNRAAELLAEAGAVAKAYEIVLSRGKSETAFQNLAVLHAGVTAATGADPLLGLPTGYEFGRTENGFYALQETDPAERTTTPLGVLTDLPDVGLDETSGTLIQLGQSGQVSSVLPVTLPLARSPDDKLISQLTAIYSKVASGPDGPTRYLRKKPEVAAILATEVPATKEQPTGRNATSSAKKAPQEPDSSKLTSGSTDESQNFWPWIAGAIALIIATVVMLKRRP